MEEKQIEKQSGKRKVGRPRIHPISTRPESEIPKRNNYKKKVYEKRGYGRPRAYSKEIGDKICKLLIEGKTLTKISKLDGMPCVATIYSWLGECNKNFAPEFLKSYNIAREIQAEVFADETVDISDDGKNDTYEIVDDKGNLVTKVNFDNIQRSKLRVDARRWRAKFLSPGKFSDKVQVTGANGKDLIPAVPTKIVFNLVKAE